MRVGHIFQNYWIWWTYHFYKIFEIFFVYLLTRKRIVIWTSTSYKCRILLNYFTDDETIKTFTSSHSFNDFICFLIRVAYNKYTGFVFSFICRTVNHRWSSFTHINYSEYSCELRNLNFIMVLLTSPALLFHFQYLSTSILYYSNFLYLLILHVNVNTNWYIWVCCRQKGRRKGNVEILGVQVIALDKKSYYLYENRINNLEH